MFVCFRDFHSEIVEKLFGSDWQAELVGTDARRRISEKPARPVHCQFTWCAPAEADVRGSSAACRRKPESAVTEPSNTEESRQTVAIPIFRRAIKVGQYRPVYTSGVTRIYNRTRARGGEKGGYIISLILNVGFKGEWREGTSGSILNKQKYEIWIKKNFFLFTGYTTSQYVKLLFLHSERDWSFFFYRFF